VVGILLLSAKAAQQALAPSLSRSPSHGRTITAVPGVTGSKETKIAGISGSILRLALALGIWLGEGVACRVQESWFSRQVCAEPDK